MADTAANAMSPSLSSTPVSVISLLTSNKGKPLLVYDNHLFRCNKIVPLKKYWVCNTRDCNVLLHTNTRNEFLSINRNHNHASEPHLLDVKQVKSKMKQHILNETTSFTKIYDEEIKKASLSDEATAAFPSVIEFRMYINFKKLLQKTVPLSFYIRFKQE